LKGSAGGGAKTRRAIMQRYADKGTANRVRLTRSGKKDRKKSDGTRGEYGEREWNWAGRVAYSLKENNQEAQIHRQGGPIASVRGGGKSPSGARGGKGQGKRE